ncbi:hypothetical protein [Helicobacter sp. 11S02596-1]|nr:hypothetical protein [Helicobacter sp. 11S02596-1]
MNGLVDDGIGWGATPKWGEGFLMGENFAWQMDFFSGLIFNI